MLFSTLSWAQVLSLLIHSPWNPATVLGGSPGLLERLVKVFQPTTVVLVPANPQTREKVDLQRIQPPALALSQWMPSRAEMSCPKLQNKYRCSKPLGIGVVCYAAVNNRNACPRSHSLEVAELRPIRTQGHPVSESVVLH